VLTPVLPSIALMTTAAHWRNTGVDRGYVSIQACHAQLVGKQTSAFREQLDVFAAPSADLLAISAELV
jgi:hypothetical protein